MKISDPEFNTEDISRYSYSIMYNSFKIHSIFPFKSKIINHIKKMATNLLALFKKTQNFKELIHLNALVRALIYTKEKNFLFECLSEEEITDLMNFLIEHDKNKNQRNYIDARNTLIINLFRIYDHDAKFDLIHKFSNEILDLCDSFNVKYYNEYFDFIAKHYVPYFISNLSKEEDVKKKKKEKKKKK